MPFGVTEGLAIASALANIGGSIAAGEKNKQRQNKIESRINRRVSDLDTWYNNNYYKDYLNSKQGEHLVNKYKQRMDEMIQKNQDNAAASGATAEQEVATKGEMQENYSNFLGDLSSKAQQRKQQIARQYRQEKSNLLNRKNRMTRSKMAQTAKGWGNVGDAFNALTQVSAATGGLDFGSGDNSSDTDIGGGQKTKSGYEMV